MIRRLLVLGIVSLLWLAGRTLAAESYQLNNGTTLSGDFVNALPAGLVVRKADGTLSERVGWTNFTQAALKQLAANPKAKFLVEPFLDVEEEEPAKKAAAAAAEIKPKDFPRMARPDSTAGMGALFSSTLSLTLLVLLYLANVYAGFETAIFRNFPVWVGCSVAAVLPILGPVILLCLPTHLEKTAEEKAAELAAAQQLAEGAPVEVAVEAHAHAQDAAHGGAPEAAPSGPPPPTVYQRGMTTFNRRFFETKFAGFLRMVPGEAEKDMVIFIKSARGEHVGFRFARILPNELYLQIQKGGATADVMIPYAEISEVQVRHKDL